MRKQILYRLCDSGMYEQRNEKLIQQATTIKMEVTHPNTLPNVACAQSSEQDEQTGKQTQAGKQSDTRRQAVSRNNFFFTFADKSSSLTKTKKNANNRLPCAYTVCPR